MARPEARLAPPASGFLLADWFVEPSADRLSRLGRHVRLRPKLMDLLVVLAARPGRVVSKGELIDALWPQQFIGESALTRAMADLRKVFADDLGAPDAIENVPKRGYRLVLPVSDAPSAAATPDVAMPETPRWPFRAPADAPPREGWFVGRTNELARLDAALDSATRRHGRVVFVTGESGTGKTSLLSQFTDRAARRLRGAAVVAGARGQAITGAGEPFQLFRQLVSTLTGDVAPAVAAGAMTVEQAESIWALLPQTADLLLDRAPNLIDTLVSRATLDARVADRTRGAAAWYATWRARLGVLRQDGGAGTPPNVSSQCIDWLTALARAMPLALILDDLHWADPVSLELIFRLASNLESVPLLVVVAYRPAEIARTAAGVAHPASSVLVELRRRHGDVIIALPETGDLAFVEALIDREPNALGRVFREGLCQRTAGHPLFTTELLRSMQERGALVRDPDGRWVQSGALDWATMPARMEAAVEARIARLPDDLRRVLDVASVQGEEFNAEVVACVLDLDLRRTVLSLGDLDRGHALVSASATAADPADGRQRSTYRFRHSALQQYLLARLDLVERSHLHTAVGKALEQLHTGHVPEMASILAFHFEQGGLLAKAIEYLLLAAEHAAALATQQQGLLHLRHAEQLVERLPEMPQRDVLELAVRMARVVTLSQTREGGHTEIAHDVQRVMALASRAPDDPRVCKALVWLALLQGLQGRYAIALRTAGEARAIAERLGATPLATAARMLGGVCRIRTGDLVGAREDLEATSPMTTTPGNASFSISGMHPEVWRLTGLGYALYFLGYPDQALARMHEAVSVAARDGAPASLVYAIGLKASVHLHRREPEAAEDEVHATLQLLRGRVSSRSDVLSGFVLGWALVQRGETPQGIDLISGAVREVRGGTLKVDWTKFLARLGEAHTRAGRATDALGTLDEALAAAASSGERYYEPELFRLRGEALEALGDRSAEEWYVRAIELARAQHAKAWELRASTSLARAWMKAGREGDARTLLAAICGWFSEGHDTPDFIEAVTILRAAET